MKSDELKSPVEAGARSNARKDPSRGARREVLRELFPIKLVGGFIALDQHLGCVGCDFCLSRRHGFWSRLFSSGFHHGGAFSAPGQARELLDKSLAFTRARVPLRFGHNTDAAFQWDFGAELYSGLPEGNPFIFMTRFPLDPGRERLFAGQKNLLLKQTITPSSKLLGINTDHGAIIEAARDVPLENVYYLIGPLAADNVDLAREIIAGLPEGCWADAKPLTRSGIPGMENVPLPTEDQLESLRSLARERGIVMTDYFGCLFRRRLGRPFFKLDNMPEYIARACNECGSRGLCFAGFGRAAREELVREEARAIGLELGEATWTGEHEVSFACGRPASRGDETHLSEIAGKRVLIGSVPGGSQGGSFCIEEDDVLERWERFGMFPGTEVGRLAEALLAAAEKELGPLA